MSDSFNAPGGPNIGFPFHYLYLEVTLSKIVYFSRPAGPA